MSFRYSLIAFITSGAGSPHKAAPGGAPKPRDQGEGDVIAYRPVFDFPFELRKTLGESGADHGQELWIVERNPSRRHHDDLGAVAFRLVEFVSRPIADLGHVAEILAGPVEVADGFEHSVIVEGVAPIAEQQLELEGLAPFLWGPLDLSEDLTVDGAVGRIGSARSLAFFWGPCYRCIPPGFPVQLRFEVAFSFWPDLADVAASLECADIAGPAPTVLCVALPLGAGAFLVITAHALSKKLIALSSGVVSSREWLG